MSPVKDLVQAVERSRKLLRQGMKPVDEAEAHKRAKAVFEGLAFFAFLRSSDPEKQKALEEMHEARIRVQELLDVIVPGYLED